MILYTIMPQELIYPTDEQEFSKQMMVQYDGIPLLVEQNADQSFQVIRIISSDPNHYLDSRCTPGSKISLFT
ncbi:YlzJ-like family protein [Bacillus sp. CGMCC 1.16607]|uniref:YlzJ-like family protein n=1 Tax=Bacillus sp. CGMCC 1.16607 TaxID=3351842 RepID=UPI0036376B1F